jgi:hypothetical protein
MKNSVARRKLANWNIESQIIHRPGGGRGEIDARAFRFLLRLHLPTSCAGVVSSYRNITVVRKVIVKGLPVLRQILRAFWVFLLGVETDWCEYQEARPRKNQVRT